MTTIAVTRATTASAAEAGFAAATSQVALRTVRKFVRTPQLIVMSIVQGAMFLLIFRYVFGGAIRSGGISYVDFLVPGYLVTGILFSGSGASVGVAEDVAEGFVDRLRSLPIPRGAVLLGRALADTALLAGTLLVTLALGFAVGFRLHTDLGSAAAALGLCVVLGFTFDWLFILIGLLAGNGQAAQGMSMIVFPLTFVSSAYVPVASMPGWLQAVAEHQPLTVMADAVRALLVGAQPGQSTSELVAASLLWAAGIVAVFAPLAVRRFTRS
jgi:ABC transporter DrrB family efflux protein